MTYGEFVRLLLVTPPMTQLNTPYPATAYLTGFLRLHSERLGLEVVEVRPLVNLQAEAVSEPVLEVIAVTDDGQPDLWTGVCSGTSDESLYDGTLSDVSTATTFESGGSSSTLIVLPLAAPWAIIGLVSLIVSMTWMIARQRSAAR